MTVTCEGQNGWRWQGYRCSDALTQTTFDDGEEYEGITISACKLTGAEGPAPDYSPPPDSETSDTTPPPDPASGEPSEPGLVQPGGLLPGQG